MAPDDAPFSPELSGMKIIQLRDMLAELLQNFRLHGNI